MDPYNNRTNAQPPPFPQGNNSKIDFDRIRTMLELFTNFSGNKGFGNFSNLHNNQQTQDPGPSKMDFDQHISSQEMEVIKSAIPFFDYNTSKHMGILIKMMELKNTFDYFEQQPEELMAQERDPNWKRNMLIAMRSRCSNEKQCLIDFALKSLDMRNLANSFSNYNPNDQNDFEDYSSGSNQTQQGQQAQQTQQTQQTNNNDLNNQLYNMLNPEQQKMFNTFNTMMNSMNHKGRENNNG